MGLNEAIEAAVKEYNDDSNSVNWKAEAMEGLKDAGYIVNETFAKRLLLISASAEAGDRARMVKKCVDDLRYEMGQLMQLGVEVAKADF